MPYSRKDLTGQMFKIWRVVRDAGHQGTDRLWECACPNGHIEVMSTSVLKRADVKKVCPKCNTTGCWADLTGRRFGRLVVEGFAGARRNSRNQSMRAWHCRCDCGGTIEVTSAKLLDMAVRSCGCLLTEAAARARASRVTSNTLPAGEAAFNAVYRRYAYNAFRRGLEWRLSKAQARRLFEAPCTYCGSAPVIHFQAKSLNGHFDHNGIDRLVSTQGYDPSNVTTACWRCNEGKNTLSVEAFAYWVCRVYKNWAADFIVNRSVSRVCDFPADLPFAARPAR